MALPIVPTIAPVNQFPDFWNKVISKINSHVKQNHPILKFEWGIIERVLESSPLMKELEVLFPPQPTTTA